MKNRDIIKNKIVESFIDNNNDIIEMTYSDKLKYLQNNSADTYQVLNDFLMILDAYYFTLTDMDLKLKAADIWKQQYEMYKNLIQLRKQTLLDFAKAKNIEIETYFEELNL